MIADPLGAAALLAASLTTDGPSARRTVLAARAAVVADEDGRAGAGLSFTVRLLAAVVDRTPEDVDIESEVDHSLGARPYYPPGHRWAGWRTDDPADWPSPERADPAVAARSLRRLPAFLRVVLVLRDVAGLGVDDLVAVLGGTYLDHAAALDEARRRLVASLDRELGGATA